MTPSRSTSAISFCCILLLDAALHQVFKSQGRWRLLLVRGLQACENWMLQPPKWFWVFWKSFFPFCNLSQTFSPFAASHLPFGHCIWRSGWPGSARLNSSRPVESARGVYTLVRSEARQLRVILQRNGDLQLYSICRAFGMRFVPEMEMLPSIWEAKAWVLKSDLVAWHSKRSKAFWFCKDEHAKRSTEDVDDDEKRPKGTAMPLMPKSDTGTRMRLFEHAGRRDVSWVRRVSWGSVALEKSNCQRSWKKD